MVAKHAVKIQMGVKGKPERREMFAMSANVKFCVQGPWRTPKELGNDQQLESKCAKGMRGTGHERRPGGREGVRGAPRETQGGTQRKSDHRVPPAPPPGLASLACGCGARARTPQFCALDRPWNVPAWAPPMPRCTAPQSEGPVSLLEPLQGDGRASGYLGLSRTVRRSLPRRAMAGFPVWSSYCPCADGPGVPLGTSAVGHSLRR